MKKSLILLGICFLFFTGFFSDLSAETEKKFSVGLNVGGFRVVGNVDGYRVGGEIGVLLSKRVGFTAEFGYGYNTSNYESKSSYHSSSEKATYTSVPISGSLVLITPVSGRFSARIGLGLGYYSIKVKSDRTYTSDYYGTETKVETDKVSGIAPHVSLGIETEVAKRVAIYAEIKQIIGKAQFEDTDDDYYEKWDIHFSGPEIKAGFRFYF